MKILETKKASTIKVDGETTVAGALIEHISSLSGYVFSKRYLVSGLKKSLKGKTVILKYGGSVFKEQTSHIINEAVFLQQLGARVVIVHGGGKDLSAVMQRFDLVPQFVNGMRVTDKEALDVALMVLAGKVNKSIVASILKHGGLACGLSGVDFGFLQSSRINEMYGYVGKVDSVNVEPLLALMKNKCIPVISTIGIDKNFDMLNINADVVVGDIAAAIKADYLFMVSDIDGVLDINRNMRSVLDIDEVYKFMQDGSISGGMIPKLESCLNALVGNVGKVHIVNGNREFSIMTSLVSTIFGNVSIPADRLGTEIIK